MVAQQFESFWFVLCDVNLFAVECGIATTFSLVWCYFFFCEFLVFFQPSSGIFTYID